MRAIPLEALADAISEAIDDGLTPEGAARRVLTTLNEAVVRRLAKQYLLEMADGEVRARELQARRNVPLTSAMSTKAKRGHGNKRSYEQGCRCDECVRWIEITDALDREYHDKLNASLAATIDKFTLEVKAQWTEELLSSTFGIPGGRVTWAQATVDDHRAHIEMDVASMAGFARDAALHTQAIAEIDTAGVRCLAEVVEMAAA